MTKEDVSKEPGGRRLRIELWLAVVFMAVAFAAGFFVRGLSTTTAATNVQDTGGYQAPPALTEDQIRSGLPAGHPSVSLGSPTPKASATPSTP